MQSKILKKYHTNLFLKDFDFEIADDGSHYLEGKELEKLCEERPEIKEAMYRDTCDAYVMKYQHEDSQDMDPDIEIDETGL